MNNTTFLYKPVIILPIVIGRRATAVNMCKTVTVVTILYCNMAVRWVDRIGMLEKFWTVSSSTEILTGESEF